MEMTDLLQKEAWADFEKALNERSRMNPCVYDTKGFTFTGFKKFANQLCPAIKSTPDGIRNICSVAHQNMSVQAQTTRKPVVAECDAGLTKICVPVFVNDTFVGIVGGCGRVQPDSEIDTFLINKATGMSEEDIASYAASVEPITEAEAEGIASDLEQRVQTIIAAMNKG